MTKAEGKIFKFDDESRIRADFLEVFDFDGSEVIKIRYPEFTAVCPFSGLPDIADVYIEYVPSTKCVELKSLKYYFVSFRNVGIYQEKATRRIYDDLRKVLCPLKLCVRTVYNVRGGMHVVCEAKE